MKKSAVNLLDTETASLSSINLVKSMSTIYSLLCVVSGFGFYIHGFKDPILAFALALVAYAVVKILAYLRIDLAAKVLMIVTTLSTIAFCSIELGADANVQWLAVAFMFTVGRLFSSSDRKSLFFTSFFFALCAAVLVFCLMQTVFQHKPHSEKLLHYFQWNSVFAFLLSACSSQFSWIKFTRMAERRQAFNSTLINFSSLGVFQVSSDGVCQFVNPAMEELLELDHLAMVGRKWYNALSVDEFRRVKPFWDAYITTRQTFKETTQLIRKNGSSFWCMIQFSPAYRSDGSVDFHVGTITDVSNFKNVESEFVDIQSKLEMTNLQLKALIDHMAEGVTVVDGDGNLTDANPAARRILGLDSNLKRNNAHDPNWNAIREDGSAYSSNERPAMRALHTGVPQMNQIMGIGQNSKVSWLRVSAVPLFEPGNPKAVKALTTFSDITETKVLEEHNASIRQRLQIGMEAMKFGIWDWDLVKDALVWDDYMYQVFCIDPADFTGSYDAFTRVLVAEDLARLNEELRECWIKKRTEFSGEFRIVRKSGEVRQIRANATCFYDEFGKVLRMVGANWDVTHEREQEAKLIHGSKMSSLGEMSSGIAHEINNPLTIILGRAYVMQALVKGLPESEKLLEGLEKIRVNSERIAKIIKGLRAFARDGEKDPHENIVVKSLVEDALSLCASKIKGADIVIDVVDPEAMTIRGSSSQMSQVLVNLISNAIDAVESLPERWVKINTEVVGDRVRISIIDSGHGVLESVRDKMMQPFFTTKPVGKGTGLGLSISSGIMKSHNGVLGIDEKNPNTCFYIEIQPGT